MVGRSTTRGPNDAWTLRAQSLYIEIDELQRAMNALFTCVTQVHTSLRQALCNDMGLPPDTDTEVLCARLAEARRQDSL